MRCATSVPAVESGQLAEPLEHANHIVITHGRNATTQQRVNRVNYLGDLRVKQAHTTTISPPRHVRPAAS